MPKHERRARVIAWNIYLLLAGRLNAYLILIDRKPTLHGMGYLDHRGLEGFFVLSLFFFFFF